jgi:hypothetical protein
MGAGIALSIWLLGHWLDNWEITVWFMAGARDLTSSSEHLYLLCTPFSHLFNGYLHLSLGIKKPGFEADHSPPHSAEYTNECCYTYTLLYAFMAYAGIFIFVWKIIVFPSVLFTLQRLLPTKRDLSRKFEIFTAVWLKVTFLMGYPRHRWPHNCETLNTHMVQFYEEVILWHVRRCEKLQVSLLKTLCS